MIQQNIALCGIKHAGKTSTAKTLAEFLHTGWCDTDDLLRNRYNEKNGMCFSVREIYRSFGEDAFRNLEAETVRGLPRNGIVIALGGGVLSNPYLTGQDRTGLGLICWIDVPDEIAYKRMLSEGLPPFLASEPDPFSAFCRQNETRRALFQKVAALRVDGASTPEETARCILIALQKRKEKTNE